MTPSIYINLEDDVSRIVARLKRVAAKNVVLVCPKRCFLFSDGVNLKLLKQQTDGLGKEVFILTMDEKGQRFAGEAGFQLKFLPKGPQSKNMSDITVKSAKEEAALELKQIAVDKPSSVVQSATKFLKSAAAATSKIISPKIEVAEAFFPKEIEERHKIQAEKKSSRKMVAVFASSSLIIILVVVLAVLPKATVIVYPKIEPLTRDLEISAAAAVKEPDVAKLLLPATKVDETMELADKFQSQGKQEVGNKASGAVKIYNFTKLPLNLKAKTTILIAGSKNYYLDEDVSSLKPTVYKNAKTKEVDENSLGASFAVTAAQGGEDYNLPAGVRMEITNQVFGSKPQFLFAKTDTPITGGTTRYLSVVSSQDASSSQNALTGQALQKLREKLKTQNLILPEKSFASEILQFATDKPVGTQSPNFQADLKIKIIGLAINPQDLEKLIYDRVSQTFSAGQDLNISADSQLSFTMKNLDLNGELGVLSAHFEGSAVPDINLSDIAASLVGKNQNQVNEILKSKPEIDRVDVTLAPSWQKTFPWFASKIDVRLGK